MKKKDESSSMDVGVANYYNIIMTLHKIIYFVFPFYKILE